MSRYKATFEHLHARGEGAFGAFVMLGDPNLQTSAAILDALIEGGADMLEVGIPFSDPVADGPVIQAAAERALAQGITPHDCFVLLSSFRERHPDVPVGILTYANLVVSPGTRAFYQAAADAGVDSILVADVPIFEAEPFIASARGAGVAPILIAAANTPSPMLKKIAELGRGYTYCVARAGVTGTGGNVRFDHSAMLAELKSYDAPPAIFGFGISTPDHVRAALSAGAAGVITGSAIVSMIAAEDCDPSVPVRDFVASMKAATSSGRTD